MSLLPIRKYGDPVLRKKTKTVDPKDPELPTLIENMFETMEAADGVGLAANQVGVSKRFCVIDPSGGEDREQRLVLLNPKVISKTGEVYEEEGCLSVPGIRAKVSRAESCKIEAWDMDGKKIVLESDGLLGKAFQHELDHLDGKLFIDYLGMTQKALLSSKLKKIKRDTEESLAQG